MTPSNRTLAEEVVKKAGEEARKELDAITSFIPSGHMADLTFKAKTVEAIVALLNQKDSEKQARMERVLACLTDWPEPNEGAGSELGALACVGMYIQYDIDKKKHQAEVAAAQSAALESSKE